MTTPFVILQMLLAAALAYSCFYRLVLTDSETIREVRIAIWFKALAAGLVLGAPVMPLLLLPDADWEPGTTPAWIWLVLLAAAALVQIVTSRHWRGGVPVDFQKRQGE